LPFVKRFQLLFPGGAASSMHAAAASAATTSSRGGFDVGEDDEEEDVCAEALDAFFAGKYLNSLMPPKKNIVYIYPGF
jgi:hypothetical protein